MDRPTIPMADANRRRAVVETLARDDDWGHPTNRAQARIARSLLASGVSHDVIYAALLAAC